MQCCRTVLVSFICITLAACVSPKMSQEVQLGKSLFVAGDFKRSFHILLPAAACGNVQAQYAVGYMYYYGYGAPQDSESGLFWMNRAATHHYMPAIRALGLIAQGPRPYGPCPGGIGCYKGGYVYKGEPAPVVHSNAVQIPHLKRTYTSYLKNVRPLAAPVQTVQLAPKKAEPVKSKQVVELKPAPKAKPIAELKPEKVSQEKTKPVAELKPKKGLQEQPKIKPVAELKVPVKIDQYALQLFGAYEIDAVKDLQEDLELKNTRIWHTQNNGKDWYVLTYGNYTAVAQAKIDKNKLIAELDDIKPWIRKLENLHQV